MIVRMLCLITLLNAGLSFSLASFSFRFSWAGCIR
jgi:hypothetical protein